MSKKIVDVGIVTVLEVELRWMLNALGINTKGTYGAKTLRKYYSGTVFSAEIQRSIHLVVTCVGRPGTTACAVAATSIVHEFSPKVLLLVGIAAGIQGKTKIGEVLLSDAVWDYEMASINAPNPDTDTDTDANTAVEVARPRLFQITFPMKEDMQGYLASKKDISSRIRSITEDSGASARGLLAKARKVVGLLPSDIAKSPIIDTTVVASGNKLLRNQNRLKYLQTYRHEQIKIGEMEATGLCDCAYESGVDWLVIRSVSDFGDSNKSNHYHEFAAQRAAVVARDFLEHGLKLTLNIDYQKAKPTQQTPLTDEIFTTPYIISFEGVPKPTEFSVRAADEKLLAHATSWSGIVYRMTAEIGRSSTELIMPAPISRKSIWRTSSRAIDFFLSRDLAIAETIASLIASNNVIEDRRLKDFVADRRLLTVRVKLERLLDLRSPATLIKLGISWQTLYGKHLQYSQSIAQLAFSMGFDGLLVPSKLHDASAYMVVFARINDGSSVELVEEEQISVESLAHVLRNLGVKIID